MNGEMKVLVVDDEEDFLKPLLMRLRKRGVSCEGAPDAVSCLELAGSGMKFDAVVMDMNLPDMDGIELLRRVKGLRPEVSVLILTGHASVSLGKRGIEAGARDYMVKPVEFDALLGKLRTLRNEGQEDNRATSDARETV